MFALQRNQSALQIAVFFAITGQLFLRLSQSLKKAAFPTVFDLDHASRFLGGTPPKMLSGLLGRKESFSAMETSPPMFWYCISLHI